MEMRMKTIKTTRFSLIFLIGLFANLCTSQAATYYTATNGNDSNAGTIAQPFRTIAKGLRLLVAGDTLYVRGGTYAEGVIYNDFSVSGGTSWANAITVSGYTGETVTLNPSGSGCVTLWDMQYVIVKDMILDGTNLNKNINSGTQPLATGGSSHHIRFQNLEVKNSPANGVFGEGNYIEFINLNVHSNGKWFADNGYPYGLNGVYWFGSNSVFDGGSYYNNHSYGLRIFNSDSSLYGNNNVVRNARIYQNGLGKGLNGTSQIGPGQIGPGGGGLGIGDQNNTVYNCLI